MLLQILIVIYLATFLVFLPMYFGANIFVSYIAFGGGMFLTAYVCRFFTEGYAGRHLFAVVTATLLLVLAIMSQYGTWVFWGATLGVIGTLLLVNSLRNAAELPHHP